MRSGSSSSAPRNFALAFFALLCLPVATAAAPRDQLRNRGVAFTEGNFVAAARDGDLEELNLFLEAGMSPNVKDLGGRTALLEAIHAARDTNYYKARASRLHVVRRLIEAGADPNQPDSSGTAPLHEAVRIGDLPCTELLLSAGARLEVADGNGSTALVHAASHGRWPIVSMLLSRGADVTVVGEKGRTPLIWATVEGFNGESGVFYTGYPEVIRTLVDAGSPLNARDQEGRSALAWAAVLGDSRTATLLLERGAEPGLCDAAGRTPLGLACVQGRRAVVELLIGHGVDANQRQEDGFTPLMLTVGSFDANVDQTRFLLDHGADPNLRAASGQTALMEAARVGSFDDIDLLVQRGADLAARNAEGKSALDIAYAKGWDNVVGHLIEHGAPTTRWIRFARWALAFDWWQGWLGPLVILLAAFLYTRESKQILPPRTGTVDHGDNLPRLDPLKCNKCNAPVAIRAHDLACPNCGSPVDVPDDYVETLKLREVTEQTLRRAVRKWNRMRMLTSWPVIAVLALLTIAWPATTFTGLTLPVGELHWALVASAGFTGVTMTVAFAGYATYLTGVRAAIPVPDAKVRTMIGRAEQVACPLCAGPVAFERGELVTQCGYCGGETYRARVGRRARRRATHEAGKAMTSVYEAMRALQEAQQMALWAILLVPFVALVVLCTAVYLVAEYGC
jgi:ankyrin repeat protein/Zn finger protein HypA/HybF involved in hydrogenase expression